MSNGFLEFGITSGDVVLQNTFLVDMVNAQGDAPYTSGGDLITFDATDGADTGAGSGVKYTPGTQAIKDSLLASGYFQMEIENAYFYTDPTATATSYIFHNNDVMRAYMLLSNEQFRTDFEGPTDDNLPGLYFEPEGKSGHSEFVMNWTATTMEVYVDSLQVKKRTDRDTTGETFPQINIGGVTGSDSTPNGYRFRNVQLVKEPQTFNPTNIASVLVLGHSYVTQGSPASWAAASGNTLDWFPGFGFDTDGNPETGGDFNDVGLVCTLFRELAKVGEFPNDNLNKARSGCSVAQGTLYLTEAIDVDLLTPDTLVCHLGTYEVNTGISLAQAEIDFKDLIDTAEAAGISRMIMQDVVSSSNNPAFDNEANRIKNEAVNNIIYSLPIYAQGQNYAINVVIDKVFDRFGGHTVNTDWMKAADNHPNAEGSYELGRTMASAAIESLTVPGKAWIAVGRRSFNGPPAKRVYPKTQRGGLRNL